MSSVKIKEWLLVGGVVAVILFFVLGLGSSLFPLIFSSFLAYASLPLIKRLEAQKISRNQATLGVLVAVFSVMALILLLAIPPLIRETKEALATAPETLSSALIKIDEFLSQYGVHIPYNRESLITFISDYSQKISSNLVSEGAQLIKDSLSNIVSVIVSLLSFTMIPVFFYYVLTDYERITSFIHSLVPRSFLSETDAFLEKVNTVLNGYIRGQLLVCLILSALYSLCLLVLNVPFGLLIGIATGIFSIIPYVGFSLGFGIAILSVLADHSGWGVLALLVIMFSCVQFLESFIITPKIVGDKVGLSPFEAILFLIIFGNLFGFIGLFVAIPAGSILKFIVLNVLNAYKKTSLYKK